MTKKNTIHVGGVPEHFNLPWHLAIENGSFEAAGISVEYQEYPGGTGAMTRALRSKDLDIAIVLSEGAVADILNGNPSKIVKVYVRSPLVWGIHVANHSPLKDVEEIFGQRYAISRFGSGSHLMAIVDASQRGWETGEMDFVKIGNLDGARQALANNQADVFFWERFMTQPYVDNGEFRRIGERCTPWPCFVVAVREELLEKRAYDVYTLLNVINDTCDSLMERPDAVELIASRYNLKLPDTREWFGLTRWGVDFEMPYLALERIIDSLETLEIVEKRGAVPDDVWQPLLAHTSPKG